MKELLLRLSRLRKSDKEAVCSGSSSFFLYRGEIAGVLGLSDSGILTLAERLTGYTKAAAGEIVYCGKELEYHSIAEAKNCGIYGIMEQTSLIARLSVLDNLAVIRPFRDRGLLIDRKELHRQACDVMKKYGVTLNLKKRIFQLSGFERQVAELYKAILNEAKIICIYGMGEDCSSQELDILKELLDKMKENGIGIIFIHYSCDKMLRFADRICIMRHGIVADEVEKSDTTLTELYRRMTYPGRMNVDMRVENAGKEKRYIIKWNDREIQIYGGEITACPAVKLWEGMAGDIPDIRRAGTNEKRIGAAGALKLAQAGVACYGKRFWETCIFQNFTLEENILLRSYPAGRRRSGLSNGKMLRFELKEYCAMFDLDYSQLKKYPCDASEDIRKQIVMFGWIVNPPEVLILADPFFAADEELIASLRSYLNHLKKHGTAILCGGDNLPELTKLADRM